MGWSRRLTCGFTTSSYNEFKQKFHESIVTVGRPLSDTAIAAEIQKEISFPGPFCGSYEDLDYLAHLSTPNVARDLDLIRNLTGYQEFDFWGWNHGTILGLTYAAMFPDSVGRMVLDGTFGRVTLLI